MASLARGKLDLQAAGRGWAQCSRGRGAEGGPGRQGDGARGGTNLVKLSSTAGGTLHHVQSPPPPPNTCEAPSSPSFNKIMKGPRSGQVDCSSSLGQASIHVSARSAPSVCPSPERPEQTSKILVILFYGFFFFKYFLLREFSCLHEIDKTT